MIFNVAQLLMEPTGASRSYTVDEAVRLPYEGDPPARLAGPVELLRIPTGLLARAQLHGAVQMLCSRCLGPATVPLDLEVEEQFIPTIDPNTGAHVPPPELDDVYRVDERQHLDLFEAVRQAAVIAEPMAPLCRPDCRGLCPQCGADRNAGACACPESLIDARWSALADLSQDAGESGA